MSKTFLQKYSVKDDLQQQLFYFLLLYNEMFHLEEKIQWMLT